MKAAKKILESQLVSFSELVSPKSFKLYLLFPF